MLEYERLKKDRRRFLALTGLSLHGDEVPAPSGKAKPLFDGRSLNGWEGLENFWRVEDGAIVVKIPAGEFLMGSPEGDGEAAERPQHRVYVSEFLIDKTEVTWRQVRKFAGAIGASVPPSPLWGTPDDYAVCNAVWEGGPGDRREEIPVGKRMGSEPVQLAGRRTAQA